MSGPVRAMALCTALFATPAVAQAKVCTPILDFVQYCSEIEARQTGYATVVMPDFVAVYRVQRGPLISVTTVAMPFDREIGGWSDVADMVFDQLLNRGTSPASSLENVVLSPGLIDGNDALRLEFTGHRNDGQVLHAWMAEALPMLDGLVILYTMTEGRDARPAQLEAAHLAAVANLEVLE